MFHVVTDRKSLEGSLAKADPACAPDEALISRTLYRGTEHLSGKLTVFRPVDQKDIYAIASDMTLNHGFTTKIAPRLWSRMRQKPFVQCIDDKLTPAVRKALPYDAAEYIADLCMLYGRLRGVNEVTVTMYTSHGQNLPEGFPGRGMHLDNRSQRLYVAHGIGGGFEWITPEAFDHQAYKSVVRGRAARSLYKDEAAPQLHKIHSGEIVYFTGTEVPHRTPLRTGNRLLIFVDSQL